MEEASKKRVTIFSRKTGDENESMQETEPMDKAQRYHKVIKELEYDFALKIRDAAYRVFKEGDIISWSGKEYVVVGLSFPTIRAAHDSFSVHVVVKGEAYIHVVDAFCKGITGQRITKEEYAKTVHDLYEEFCKEEMKIAGQYGF